MLTYNIAGNLDKQLSWLLVLRVGRSKSFFGTRLSLPQEHLDRNPDGHLVVFIDAHDVFTVRDEDAIRSIAATFDLRDTVVVSAERQCYAYTQCGEYPPAPTSFRYVNTGGVLARNGPHFRSFVSNWADCVSKKFDDQRCVHHLYLFPKAWLFRAGPKFRVILDHHCRLFQTSWGTKLEGGPDDRRCIPSLASLVSFVYFGCACFKSSQFWWRTKIHPCSPGMTLHLVRFP